LNERLIPIDHGYCFLDSLDWKNKEILENLRYAETYGAWMQWPQSSQPLNRKCKKWVENYDIEASLAILEERGLSKGAQREHKMRLLFLKACVKKNMTPREMGLLCSITKSIMSSFLDVTRDKVIDALNREGIQATEEKFFPAFEQRLESELDIALQKQGKKKR
jgi:hypothetical protein